jgi:predicted dehydrogenase
VDEPKAQALAEKHGAESYPTHEAMLDATDLEKYLFRRQYLRGERGRAAYDAGLWADPLSHWVADLLGHRQSPPTADLALESMVVTDGIYWSADLGREATRVTKSSRSRRPSNSVSRPRINPTERPGSSGVA